MTDFLSDTAGLKWTLWMAFQLSSKQSIKTMSELLPVWQGGNAQKFIFKSCTCLLHMCACLCVRMYAGTSYSSIIHLEIFWYVNSRLWRLEVASQIIQLRQLYQRSIIQDTGGSCMKFCLSKRSLKKHLFDLEMAGQFVEKQNVVCCFCHNSAVIGLLQSPAIAFL